MKYENLFKIHIPEPCHEDWGKMTPNEQGAFCKSCAKTVVDFSDRTDNEIQKYLLENIDNHICGRFRINQLDDRTEEIPKLKIEEPKFSFPSFLLPVSTPFRVAALSLMLFASVALTSCGNSNEAGGDDDGRTVGIMIVEPDTLKKTDSTQYNFNDRIQGGVSIDKTQRINKTENTNKKDSACSIKNDELRTLGKPIIKYTDSLKTDSSETRMIKGEVAPQKDPPRKMGMIKKKD